MTNSSILNDLNQLDTEKRNTHSANIDSASSKEIVEIINENLQDVILEQDAQAKQAYLVLEIDKILDVCRLLHTHEKLYFDHLACITGVDNGEKDGRLEIIYHLIAMFS